SWNWNQTGEPSRVQSPDCRSNSIRDREPEKIRHVRAQGEHHEVYRGELSRLGVRARRLSFWQRDVLLVEMGTDKEGERRKKRQRGDEVGVGRRQDPRQRRDRRYHFATDS